MEDCIFCKIIKGDIPAEIVYENEETLAFLDVNPRAPGHTMVIPKVHARNILDLPDEKIEPLFGAVKKTVKLIEKALDPDGFTMGLNRGKVSGQVVDHIHFHIIPRFDGDGGSSLHSVVNNKPDNDLSEIAERIRGE